MALPRLAHPRVTQAVGQLAEVLLIDKINDPIFGDPASSSISEGLDQDGLHSISILKIRTPK
jgi:hypothetical protein